MRKITMGGGVPGTPAFPVFRDVEITIDAQSEWALYVIMDRKLGSPADWQAAADEWLARIPPIHEGESGWRNWARIAQQLAQKYRTRGPKPVPRWHDGIHSLQWVTIRTHGAWRRSKTLRQQMAKDVDRMGMWDGKVAWQGWPPADTELIWN